MLQPMALCLQDLNAPSGEPQFLRCVALAGRVPGLRLDERGAVLWQCDDPHACELWVSADERLILYRLESAATITLHRVGRSLDVPTGKPVVVLDQDEVEIGLRRFRIHVHGPATAVAPPSVFVPEPGILGRLAHATAAAAALVSALAAAGCGPNQGSQPGQVNPIEVRERPPAPGPPVPPPEPPSSELREQPLNPIPMIPEPRDAAKESTPDKKPARK